MNPLRRFKIGPRLAVGFSILVLLMAAVAALGAYQIRAVSQGMEALMQARYGKVELINDIQKLLMQQGVRLRNVVILTQPQDLETEFAEMEDTVSHISARMKQLNAALDEPQSKDLLAQSAQSRATWLEARNEVVRLVQARQQGEAVRHMVDVARPAHQAYYDALGKISRRLTELAAEARDQNAAMAQRAIYLIAALAGLAGLVAVGISLVISRSIVRPISEAVRVAETVASGDLRARINAEGRDEPAQLLKALRGMNESLARLVGQVRASSGNIATGAGQIATGNEDLSQRTEEQASNLQQTASSMEEITSTVKASADTAREASELATAASTVAGQGGAAVGEVVQTMQAITESSRRIADITGLIDGIAFQTNILALNAAVEAARAGEQGRGFAVVAGEVRSLAQRSAEAAKEIKALIADSVDKVEAGSQQAGNAGRTMESIVAQVRRVSDLIGQISTATHEQTRGISQVSEAVTQLDQVTQQNAALVEESAAAAESLNQQAAQLVEAVSVFKIDARDGGMAAPALASAPAFAAAPAARPAATPVTASATSAAPVQRPAPVAAAASAPIVSPVSGKPSPAAADGWDSF